MALNDIQHPDRNLPNHSTKESMKSMFRIVAIAASLAAAAMPAAWAANETQPVPPPPAQPPAAPGDKAPDGARPRRWQRDPMEQLQRLSEALSLTQEQKDQITAIIKGNAPQRQAIMNDAALTPEDRRAKMRKLMKGTQPKIRALLTTEQQQKFDAMPRPEFGRGPRHGGPHNPPPPGGNPPPPDAPPAAGSPPPPANSL
jgi:Spy/CpxP family protein refolding chaperone